MKPCHQYCCLIWKNTVSIQFRFAHLNKSFSTQTPSLLYIWNGGNTGKRTIIIRIPLGLRTRVPNVFQLTGKVVITTRELEKKSANQDQCHDFRWREILNLDVNK